MKNVIIIIILFISNIVFSQYEINAEQVPSFNRIDKESNHTTALNSLNHNIQDFIANTVSQNFVKQYFKPQDSIEFNFNMIISKNGIVNSININTDVSVFNEEIKRVLLLLPKFSPGKALIVKTPQDFYFTYIPQYYVNDNYELKSIHRYKLEEHLNINSGEVPIIVTASKLGYKLLAQKVEGSLFFHLSEDRTINDLYFESPHVNFDIMLKKVLSETDLSTVSIFSNLETNTCYSMPFKITINETFGNKSFISESNQDLKLLQTINKSTQFENGPILSSCNKLKTNQQKLLCTKKKIIQIVGRNLNDEFSKKHKLNGSHRVFAYFDVNEKGEVENIKINGSHYAVRNDVANAIKMLPVFIPATKDGKPVKASYSLPFTFNF